MSKSQLPTTRARTAALGSLLVSATLIGSCGAAGSTLDTSALERAAAASVLAQHGVSSLVSCPQSVPRRLGFRFWCTARLDVGSYPLLVVETNAAGRVRYENSAPLRTLDIARVQSAIAQRVQSTDHSQATVRCPATVLQHEGVGFECAAEVTGRRIEFMVYQLNSAGRVRFSPRA